MALLPITRHTTKVRGVVAGIEGADSPVVSATPKTSLPTLALTTSITDGVLHVYFSVSGGYWTPTRASLYIDEVYQDWIDYGTEDNHFAFQTTELPNASHTVTVVLDGDGLKDSVAASTTVVTDNSLSAVSIGDAGDNSSDDEAAYITGLWSSPTNWKITIADEGETPIRTVTGFGTVIDYTWDGLDGNGYPAGDYVSYVVTVEENTAGGSYIAQQSPLKRAKGRFFKVKHRDPPYYIAVYPEIDTFVTPSHVPAFRTRAFSATNQLRFRYQSAGISQEPYVVPIDGWQWPVLGDDWDYGYLDLARIAHFSCHGSTMYLGSYYGAGATEQRGLRADRDDFNSAGEWYGVASHFSNDYGPRSRVSGDLLNVHVYVRYKMVFLDGCNTGNPAGRHCQWPLAFGIVPHGKPAKGSGFIGWAQASYPTDLQQTTFIAEFWRNLVTLRKTFGKSVDDALSSSGLPRKAIRVVGDRSMRLP